MNQGSLFDQPITRSTDPVTSHQAAEKVRPALKGLRLLFFETLSRMGNIPRTANEVAAQACAFEAGTPIYKVMKKRESIRKRAKELVDAGWIVDRGARECRVNGSEATTYEVNK